MYGASAMIEKLKHGRLLRSYSLPGLRFSFRDVMIVRTPTPHST